MALCDSGRHGCQGALPTLPSLTEVDPLNEGLRPPRGSDPMKVVSLEESEMGREGLGTSGGGG